MSNQNKDGGAAPYSMSAKATLVKFAMSNGWIEQCNRKWLQQTEGFSNLLEFDLGETNP